jgi:hypothetical protein
MKGAADHRRPITYSNLWLAGAAPILLPRTDLHANGGPGNHQVDSPILLAALWGCV